MRGNSRSLLKERLGFLGVTGMISNSSCATVLTKNNFELTVIFFKFFNIKRKSVLGVTRVVSVLILELIF